MQALSLFDVESAAGTATLPPPAGALPAAVVPRARAGPPVPRPAGPVLLAVDGNSLAHRAFHAYSAGDGLAADRTPRHGFLALLAAVCDRTAPEGIVVGFDCRDRSARRDRHPEYKANRAPKDPALHALLDETPALLGALGVAVVVVEGWEADDVVASAAAHAEAAGWRCVVATSDRDAFALVSDRTLVLRLRSGMDNAIEVTPRRLRADLGVEPRQYVEYAALRGDVSDNLPGIRGVGPSKAAALLAAYPTVAAAAADPLGCRSVLGRALGQALLDDLADPATSVFRRNVELMSVRRDLPLDLEATRRSADPWQVAERLRAWGLPGLTGRMAVAVGMRPEAPPPVGDADAPPF